MTKICVVSKAVTLRHEHASESPGGFVKAEIVRCQSRLIIYHTGESSTEGVISVTMIHHRIVLNINYLLHVN